MTIALVTERLALREFDAGDVDDLLSTDGDPRVMRYVGNGATRTREELSAGLGRVTAFYARRPGLGLLHGSLRANGQYVGAFGLFPLPDGSDIEIAYRLRADCWGRGLATEGARAVLEHGFASVGLARVVGITFPDNLASQNVLRKIGLADAGIAFHYGREMRLFVATAPSRGTPAAAAR